MNTPHADALNFKRGVLLMLSRDTAKALFASRGDDALRSFLGDIVNDAATWREDQAVDCEHQWKIIDQGLTEDADKDQASALRHCILGGRPMFQGDEMSVCLVRPDMVPHVAAAVGEIDDALFQEKLTRTSLAGADAEAAVRIFAAIRDFYHSAATHRHAVVFAVHH